MGGKVRSGRVEDDVRGVSLQARQHRGVGVDLDTLTNGYSGTCDSSTNADMQALLDYFADAETGNCPGNC